MKQCGFHWNKAPITHFPRSLFGNLVADSNQLFLPVAAVHAEAERLSARHTAEGGHRSMDILHVATALSMGAREFLSFDGNQTALASVEGLTVKP